MELFFSVIIPTYNRTWQLTQCLHALSRQTYPRECFEVIVVNDGGETTIDDLDAFKNELDMKFVCQQHAGPAAARNTGAGRAKGIFLAFTDDDCMPAPDWLEGLAIRCAAAPNHLIGGRTLNVLHQNAYSRVSQGIIDLAYSYYNVDPSKARFFASNNISVAAERFHRLGGFDTSFTTSEDRDLCDRWLHSRYLMSYASEAVVFHSHSLTLGTFVRQQFAYGRGAFRYRQRRAHRRGRRMGLEPHFFLTVIRYPFNRENNHNRLVTMTLVAIWFLANTAGFFFESGRFRTRSTNLPAESAPHLLTRVE